MKKLLTAAALIIFTAAALFAQNKILTGTWLMTKAEMGGNTQEVYQILNLREDGSAELQGMVFGTWQQNSGAGKVSINSERVKEFAGVWNISHRGTDELVLELPDRTLYFVKYDPLDSERENKKSPFPGVWKLTTPNEDNADVYLKFTTPRTLKIKYMGEGYSGNQSGEWIYNKADKTVILLTRDRELRGKNKIIESSDTSFVMENDGRRIEAVRLEQNAGDREKIAPAEYGDTPETDRLPWSDPETVQDYLSWVTELQYRESTLLDDFDLFISKNITTGVSVNRDLEEVDIDPIFPGLSAESYFNDNPFFPLEEPYNYSVKGKKSISVPAGTFNCTVLEGETPFGDGRMRLYMIDNRPGVYAKIISVGDSFGKETYTMYELTEIKGLYANQTEAPLSGKWFPGKLLDNGKDSGISGYWMITNSSSPYRVMYLSEDHSVYDIEQISTVPLSENYREKRGTWMYDSAASNIIFNTDPYYSICSGSFDITKLTKDVMQLSENKLFIRINPEKITRDNEESGMEGLWKIKDFDGRDAYYSFEAPYFFRKGFQRDDMPMSGLWFYSPESHDLFIGYQMHRLEGFSKVVKINENTLHFKTGLTAERVR